MSEYQYYEFQAIDMSELRSYSTRALGQLSASLESLAWFPRIDGDLLHVAAETSRSLGKMNLDPNEVRTWVGKPRLLRRIARTSGRRYAPRPKPAMNAKPQCGPYPTAAWSSYFQRIGSISAPKIDFTGAPTLPTCRPLHFDGLSPIDSRRTT